MTGIIDCHLTLDPSGTFKRDEFTPAVPALPGDLVAAMDQQGVERGVAAPARPQDNGYILQCRAQHPARLHAAVRIDPRDPGALLAFTESASQGACGLLLDPLGQGFDDRDAALLDPLAEAAGTLDALLLVDCRPALGLSSVEGAMRLAHGHPETPFVLLHAASQRFADLLPAAETGDPRWRNFFIDVSGTAVRLRHSPFWEQFRWTMRGLGARHLVFGSGWPSGDIGEAAQAVRDLGFSAEEEQLIFRENMARLLARRG
jgi:predicted TIM-barrel fold metal-dependent hydrolase